MIDSFRVNDISSNSLMSSNANYKRLNLEFSKSSQNVLVYGTVFFKTLHYNILKQNEPIPEKRFRYYNEYELNSPKSSKKKNNQNNSQQKSYNISKEISDYERIVCIQCGKLGHIICDEYPLNSIQIDWKPEKEYKELLIKPREVIIEDLRLNTNNNSIMNIGDNSSIEAESNKVKPDYLWKYNKFNTAIKQPIKIDCWRCGENHKISDCQIGRAHV